MHNNTLLFGKAISISKYSIDYKIDINNYSSYKSCYFRNSYLSTINGRFTKFINCCIMYNKGEVGLIEAILASV